MDIQEHYLTFRSFLKIFKKIQIYQLRNESKIIILNAKMSHCFVFLKVFSEKQKDLVFEKQLYEYIDKNVKNTIYENYFVTYIQEIKIKGSDLQLIIPEGYVVNQDITFLGIVTKNHSGSLKLVEFFKRSLSDSSCILQRETLILLVFEILYGIYIMNCELDIIHNDLHFGNILYEALEVPYDQKYSIRMSLNTLTTFTLKKKFNIRIFDYDCATKPGRKGEPLTNPRLDEEYCKTYGSCNKYSQKDVFILVTTLLEYIVKYKIYDLNPVVNTIIDNNSNLKKAIVDNLRNEKIFWSSFCTLTNKKFSNSDCSETSYPDLDIEKVISRYYNKFSNDLNVTEFEVVDV